MMESPDRATRFRQLISQELYSSMWGYCFRLTGNREDTEDLSQEVLVRAYLHLDQLRSPELIKGWLFAIVRARFCEVRRKGRLMTLPEYPDEMRAAGHNPELRVIRDDSTQCHPPCHCAIVFAARHRHGLMEQAMQRIVHVTTSHDATDNRIFHKECRSLAAAGYNVTLIAPHDRDETIDGIRIIALPRVEGLRRRITTLPPRALRACRATSADLYHFHDPELIPFMARLKRSGVPLVYDMHENIAADIPAKRYVPRALKPLVRNVLPRLLRGWLLGMHVVFAVKEFPALYPWIDSSAVVQNLFKLDNLPQNIPAKPERFTVGYLGGMTAVRGCLQTLDVLAGLQRDGLYIGYEAVGPEMEGRMAEYEAAVRSHGLRHVNFTGELPLHDAYAHVAQCHAGLLLFQPSPNHDNCCPNKLFEYMALGLPVVASNFSLISEVVEGTGCGLTVDPLDTGEISAAIRTLAADPAAAAEMGGRGRRAVREHYSWESAEKNLLELYARVLGKQ